MQQYQMVLQSFNLIKCFRGVMYQNELFGGFCLIYFHWIFIAVVCHLTSTRFVKSVAFYATHFVWFYALVKYRPHTTVKNARNVKSVAQAKLPYFEEIFKLWTREKQELPFLQILISISNQDLASCFRRETVVKWISFFLEYLMMSIVYAIYRQQPRWKVCHAT